MYRNPEHYADPTAGQAIENIEKEEERMARQRRWGGRKHRRDGAHRMEEHTPRTATEGKRTINRDSDATVYRLVWKANASAEGEKDGDQE